MITEASFLDSDQIPEAMIGRFDEPWEYVGDVSKDFPPGMPLQCICDCNEPPLVLNPKHDTPIERTVMQCVTMPHYWYVTGDMLRVGIYFGTCDECDKVFWAKQAPPYTRERAYQYA